MKDYYEVLGVSRNENFSNIKKAYKKLATKWHPDKNSSNKKMAEEKFKEVSEAYQVLSDPAKRDEYDNSQSFGSVFSFGGMGSDPFDLFNSHFGMNPFAQMQQHMQMMSQHFENLEKSMDFNSNSFNSNNHGSRSSSTSYQYVNNNGRVSKKTVRVSNKNGKVYKEVTEEKNGKKKITKYFPDGTKSFIDDEKIKKLKD